MIKNGFSEEEESYFYFLLMSCFAQNKSGGNYCMLFWIILEFHLKDWENNFVLSEMCIV